MICRKKVNRDCNWFVCIIIKLIRLWPNTHVKQACTIIQSGWQVERGAMAGQLNRSQNWPVRGAKLTNRCLQSFCLEDNIDSCTWNDNDEQCDKSTWLIQMMIESDRFFKNRADKGEQTYLEMSLNKSNDECQAKSRFQNDEDDDDVESR